MKEPEPTFCVSAKLWFHSNTHIWVPCFLHPENINPLAPELIF